MLKIEELCTLDDSSWWLNSKKENKPHIQIYSHALYIPHENSFKYISFISFKCNNKSEKMRKYSQDLFNFLNDNINNYKLVACKHYIEYENLKPLIETFSSKRLRKNKQKYLRSFFKKSDQLSRRISKMGKEHLIKKANLNDFLKKIKKQDIENNEKMIVCLNGHKYNIKEWDKKVTVDDYL